jgi:site-specific DNA recombinase
MKPESNDHKGTALIYCRVSTRNQEEEGTSLETQEQACIAHAQGLGYEIGRIFREVYTGHEALDRPELNRLREAAKTRQYQAVIVHAIDRLTRAQGLTGFLLIEFDRYGVELISVLDPLDKTPQGKFLIAAKEFIAEVEREKIRERSVRGKRARLLGTNGQPGKIHNSGPELYGYHRDKEQGVRTVYEPEAMIVRQIFRQYAEDGTPLREIVRSLNAQGTPPPSAGKLTFQDDRAAHWGQSTIRRILTEPAYKGETVAWRWQHAGRGTSVGLHDPSEQIRLPDGTTPPLVTPNTWQKAQERFEINRGGAPRPNGRQYLLARRIFCGVCGRRMRAEIERGLRVYRCSSRESPAGPCGAKRVPADDLVPHEAHPRDAVGRLLPITPALRRELGSVPGVETAIWSEVAAALRDPQRVFEEVERRRESGPDRTLQADLDAARQEIRKLERQQQRLVALYAEADVGMPLETVKQQMSATERQKEQWQEIVERYEQQAHDADASVEQLEALTAYCDRVAQNLEGFAFEEKRFALDALDVFVVANGREWGWHSRTLAQTAEGREFTTCSCPGPQAVERLCWHELSRRFCRI